jgi:hypothetical protein
MCLSFLNFANRENEAQNGYPPKVTVQIIGQTGVGLWQTLEPLCLYHHHLYFKMILDYLQLSFILHHFCFEFSHFLNEKNDSQEQSFPPTLFFF